MAIWLSSGISWPSSYITPRLNGGIIATSSGLFEPFDGLLAIDIGSQTIAIGDTEIVGRQHIAGLSGFRCTF